MDVGKLEEKGAKDRPSKYQLPARLWPKGSSVVTKKNCNSKVAC